MRSSRTLWIVAVGLVLACAGVGAGLWATAAPWTQHDLVHLVHPHRGSLGRECRDLLKNVSSNERSYFEGKDRYATTFAEMGFEPDADRHFTYFLSDREVLRPVKRQGPFPVATVPPVLGGHRAGVFGTCPDACFVVAVCAGRSAEGHLEVWSVSSAIRESGGHEVPAGQPFNDVDGRMAGALE
jgi:hypothetical protein